MTKGKEPPMSTRSPDPLVRLSPPRWQAVATVGLAGLALAAASVGLVHPGVYRDNALVAAGWLGNDLVTVAVGLPVLVASGIAASRGSARAWLVWLGAVEYLLYNYAFYLFGTHFNALFLAYVALVAGSIYALAAALVSADLSSLPPPRAPRAVAAWMAAVAVVLGGLWTATSAAFWFTGTPPAIVETIGHPTNLIAALDLTLVVPLNALGAWLLWRRSPWGLVVGALANVKGALYMAALTASTLTAWAAGASDEAALAGLWASIGAGCLAASVALLRR
jgi:hypothetical protein